MVLTVEEIMSKKIPKVEASATAVEAARLMKSRKRECLMVVKGNKPLGIITEADLINKVLAKGVNPQKTQVSTLASRTLVTVPLNYDIAAASAVMAKHNIRHLPVVDKGKIVGIVTARDIIKHLRSYIRMLVRSVLYEE